MPDTDDESAPLVLELSGDLDMARSDEIVVRGEELLHHAVDGRQLVVDLARVDFLDSSGLSGLLRLRRLALERGVSIALRDVSPRVSVVLSLSGVEQALPSE